MRCFQTLSLLLSLGFCLIPSAGCMSSKNSNALADALFDKVLAPPIELTVSTMAFQKQNGRWPTNYAELRSFTATGIGCPLTNYDRVDFAQKVDGSVDIYAVGPYMTNQMTLHPQNDDQK